MFLGQSSAKEALLVSDAAKQPKYISYILPPWGGGTAITTFPEEPLEV